jgi:excisionase family DNA binding protein
MTYGPDMKPLMTDFDVMALLHVSRSTVRRMRNQGYLPYVTVGRLIRYPAAGVHRVMTEGCPSTPPA